MCNLIIYVFVIIRNLILFIVDFIDFMCKKIIVNFVKYDIVDFEFFYVNWF